MFLFQVCAGRVSLERSAKTRLLTVTETLFTPACLYLTQPQKQVHILWITETLSDLNVIPTLCAWWPKNEFTTPKGDYCHMVITNSVVDNAVLKD